MCGERASGVSHSVIDILRQFRTVVLVVVAALLGFVDPLQGDLLTPLITPLVAFLVFSSLSSVGLSQFSETSSLVSGIGLVTTFVVLPLGAVAVGRALLSGPELAGVLIMVAGPTTAGSALVWAQLSDSDVIVTALLTMGSLLLAPLVTPVVVSQLLGATATLAYIPIVWELVAIVGGGFLLHWIVPEGRIRESHLDSLSLLVVAGLVYIGVASSDVAGLQSAAVGWIAVTTLLVCLIALGTAVLFGTVVGLSGREVRALYFGTAMKNLGVAIAVAAVLSEPGVVAAIVVYYVVEQFVSSLIVGVSGSG